MNRRILTLLLLVLFVDTTFGLDLSLAPGLSVQNAFVYIIMVVYLIETAVRHNRRFELPSVLVPFGILIAYCIMSWFVASFIVKPIYYDPVATAISLKGKRVDHIILFLLFFYGVASNKEALSLLRVFLWMMVAGNLLTVVDGFNIPDLGIIHQREDGRLGGPMGESNQYGAFLVMTLPAIFAMFLDPRIKRWMAMFGSGVTVLALMAAGSRGSFVGLFVGGVFAAIFLRSYISMRQVAIGMVASIAATIAIFVVFLSTDIFGDLVQRFIDKSSGDTRSMTSGRSAIWATTIERMLDYPISFLTGFGWDAYVHMRGFHANTHNFYLNIMFNLGIPALTLYLVLVYNLFAACRRALRKATGIVRAHMIAFVFGFAAISGSVFFVELFSPWIYVWAYVGLIMRIAVNAMRGESPETERRVSVASVPAAT